MGMAGGAPIEVCTGIATVVTRARAGSTSLSGTDAEPPDRDAGAGGSAGASAAGSTGAGAAGAAIAGEIAGRVPAIGGGGVVGSAVIAAGGAGIAAAARA